MPVHACSESEIRIQSNCQVTVIVIFYFQTYSTHDGPQHVLFKLPAPGAGAGGGAEAADPAADVPPAGPHDLLETILVHQHLPRRQLCLTCRSVSKFSHHSSSSFRDISLGKCTFLQMYCIFLRLHPRKVKVLASFYYNPEPLLSPH